MKTTRVFFALTPKTKEVFLPVFDGSSFSGAEFSWADVSDMEPVRWEHMLREYEPEVVVSGWGTPLIPKEIAGGPREPA